MSFTILNARTILQAGARNAGVSGTFSDDPYNATQGDIAIQGSLNHFARETHCIQKTGSVLLPGGTNAVSLSALTDFEPERWLRIWPVALDTASTVRTRDLVVSEYSEMVSRRKCRTDTGAPTEIAFSTTLTDAITLEDSDQAYNLYIKYWTLLTAYTAGTATTSTVLNFPADIATEVLMTRGVILLQENQPEQLKSGTIDRLQARYDRYVESKRGVGSQGVRSIRMMSLRESRLQRRGR